MGKYWAYFKNNINITLTYRGPIVVWLLGNFLSLVAIIAVWLSSSTNGLIAGYTKPELITYYIFTIFLQWLMGWFPFYGVVDEIKHGEIVLTTLTKPISFFKRKFAEEAGWHSVSLFVGLISTLLFIVFYKNYIVYNLEIFRLLPMLLAIVLGIVITFSLSICLGLFSFWFTEIGALDEIFWALRLYLGGQGIPISFIPEPINFIVRLLPFRYTFSFPLEIYFGKLTNQEMIFGFLIQVVWIFILITAYRFMWSRGRKAYTSFGQ